MASSSSSINGTLNTSSTNLSLPVKKSKASCLLTRLAIKVVKFITWSFSYLLGINSSKNQNTVTSSPSNSLQAKDISLLTNSSSCSNRSQSLSALSSKSLDIVKTHESGDGAYGCIGLKDLRKYDAKKDFSAIRSHHYDWWMFPIDRSSSKGTRFQLFPDNFKELSKDSTFIKNYLDGVKIVLSAWGWEMDKNSYTPTSSKFWDGYGIRLAKMANSLKLFSKYAQGDARNEIEKAYKRVRQFYQNVVTKSSTACSDLNLVKKYCE